MSLAMRTINNGDLASRDLECNVDFSKTLAIQIPKKAVLVSLQGHTSQIIRGPILITHKLYLYENDHYFQSKIFIRVPLS